MKRLLFLTLLLAQLNHPAPARADGELDDDLFDTVMAAPPDDGDGDGADEGVEAPANEVDTGGATVRVPLPLFERAWARLQARAPAPARDDGPPVILGEAHYEGHAEPGALALTVHLGVTLGASGEWKTVPLVGDDVVLVRATAGGKPIGVTRAHGYQVWVTRAAGEQAIELSLRVPARGPRGSTEYGFRAVRAPVTTFSCRFPEIGVEPRLDGAVESSLETQDGATVLRAALTPATRIHLVGFRDLGDGGEARARAHAETLSLLSVDEGKIEVFSIIRYRILYAGARAFDVELPAGARLVSAEGGGGFHYEVANGVLHGETAYPIRDSYEISLRLSQELGGAAPAFEVPLPRARGVEREVGWLAVEVPGKARLEEVARRGPSAVDARQLPAELVASAVSPILRAYRYTDAGARGVTLRATRLPEQETEAEGIDRVRAFTVVSDEGVVLTEMRLSLRNRLRQSLSLTLPAGARVRSTLLDGQPVKPSRGAAGELVLPLDRSRRNGDRLEPITLHVVLEDQVRGLDLVGHPVLRLPAVELPVATLVWSVFLPDGNVYSELHGDVGAQRYAGRGQFAEAPAAAPVADVAPAAAPEAVSGAHGTSGAMPVRIELPRAGVRLEHQRYWLAAGQPATVSFRTMRRWLAHPIALLLALLTVAGARLAGRASRLRLPSLAAALVALAALATVAGVRVALVVAAGALLVAFSPRRLRALGAGVAAWARALPERWRADRERADREARALRELDAQLAAGRPVRHRLGARLLVAAGRAGLAAALVVLGLMLADRAIALAIQLSHPLGG